MPEQTLDAWLDIPPAQLLSQILRNNAGNNRVIARFNRKAAQENFGWFTDVRNQAFVPIFLPAWVGDNVSNRPEIFTPDATGLEVGAYYVVAVRLQSRAYRSEKQRPFALRVADGMVSEQYAPEPEEFVKNIAAKYTGNQALGITLGQAVDTIANEINRLTETFVYELLQNADDYPQPGSPVRVVFDITRESLLVMHNGAAFTPGNVYALCDVAGGDKAGDNTKTGFKGIGFKAVFTHSENVLVRSGGYTFQFFKPQDTTPIPWQIIPQWVPEENIADSFPPIFFRDTVSIAIRPRKHELLGEGQGSFFETLNRVFEGKGLLLFLRNIREVRIRKAGRQEKVVLKEQRDWFTHKGRGVEVSAEMQAWIQSALTTGGNKKVPEKFAGIKATEISFAAAKSGDNQIVNAKDTRLFVYLPTNINLHFPFLLNGDFIPDGSRTELHDLVWNTYLMEEAGKQFIHWMRRIGMLEDIHRDYLRLLPDFPACKASIDAKHHKYVDAFEQGVLAEKDAIAFIPDTNGALRKPAELMVDNTGFSQLYGDAALKELAGATDRAILHQCLLQYAPLLKLLTHDEAAIAFDWHHLKAAVEKNEALSAWLRVPENNARFLQWLTEAHRSALADWPVYLSDGGQLLAASALFRTLGDDGERLVWAACPFLHPEVEALTRSLQLPAVDHYTPEAYIANYLLRESNLKTHQADFAEKEANYGFWRYIRHHVGTLTDSLKATLLRFGFYDFEGNYVSGFEGKKVYQTHPALATLLEVGALPEDHIALFAPDYAAHEDELPGWRRLWAKLGVGGFEPAAFLKEEIAARANHILDFTERWVLVNRVHNKMADSLSWNRALWNFVYESIHHVPAPEQAAVYDALGELPVMVGKQTIEAYALNLCYLGDEYNNEKLEQLLSQFTPTTSYAFTVGGYGSKVISGQEIGGLWKRCGITYKPEGLIPEILARLNDLSEANRGEAFALFYNYRHSYEEFSALKSFPLLLTAEGTYAEPSKVILGDEYTGATWMMSVLPMVAVENQLNASYAAENGAGQELLQFLKELGCKAVETEAAALELKVDALLKQQWSEGDTEGSLRVVNTLAAYYTRKVLLEPLLTRLKELPLMSADKKASYFLASTLHFGTSYHPAIDLQGLQLQSPHLPPFLNDIYLQSGEDREPLIRFFKAIGITERFTWEEWGSKYPRAEMPADYLAWIAAISPMTEFNAVSQGYAHQHYSDRWVTLRWIELIKEPKIATQFWNYLLDSQSAKERLQRKLKYNTAYGSYAPKGLLDNYVAYFLKANPTMPTKGDTICRLPSELYSRKFEGIVPESQLLFIDLRTATIGNETLEAWIGVRQELNLVAILSYLTTQPTLTKLQEAGIWKSLQQKLMPDNKLTADEQAALLDFKETGKLPSQTGQWNLLSDLIYKSKDFRLHLARSNKLVHDDALAAAEALGVEALTVEKLNPSPEGDADDDFAAHLKSRLIYIAFFLHPEDYEAKAEALQDMVAPLTFVSGKRIVMKYAGISTYDEACVRRDDTIYYLLRRKGYRDDALYEYLHSEVFKFREKVGSISLKFFKDFLINDEEDVRLICKSEHPENFPQKWEPATEQTDNVTKHATMPALVSEALTAYAQGVPTPIEANYERLSDAEIAEIKRLTRKPDLTEDAMHNLNLESQLKGMLYLQENGYDTDDADESFHENHAGRLLKPVTHPEHPGKTFTVMCRSAKSKVLHISYTAWENIAKAEYKLFVWTGNMQTSFLVHSQKELSALSKDAWVMKLDEADKQTSLTNLFTGKAPLTTNLFMYIRLPGTTDNSALFAAIEKNIEDRAGDELGGNTLDEDAV